LIRPPEGNKDLLKGMKYCLSLNRTKNGEQTTYKEEVVYEKPNVIFGKLERLEADIQNGIKELKHLM
jgi:hypothetical protein